MSQQIVAGTNILFPDCIICLTPLQSNLVTPILCGHVFHEDCFRKWRNKGNENICPLCKRDSSNILKLIYDIKYYQDDNNNQEPQTLNQLLERNKYLKIKNDAYEEEIKELKVYNDECQKKVEGFKEKVEENCKNMARYKNDYLSMKALLDEEKEKNEKNQEKIEKLKKDVQDLQDFKNKFEMKNEIDEETQKIILSKDIDKMQDDFEKQFYKLLNDDDEKKGLHEYFYVLQQKILKLTQENEELTKFKKNKEKEKYDYNNNTTYTQLLKLSENDNKRNYLDYMRDSKNKKIENEKNKIISNNNIDNNKKLNEINIITENVGNKRQINAIKLKNNNNNSTNTEFKKIFNNPFKKKECTFL